LRKQIRVDVVGVIVLLTLGRFALPALLSANQLPYLYRPLVKPGSVLTGVMADTPVTVSY
jgi:hypothetical protein